MLNLSFLVPADNALLAPIISNFNTHSIFLLQKKPNSST